MCIWIHTGQRAHDSTLSLLSTFWTRTTWIHEVPALATKQQQSFDLVRSTRRASNGVEVGRMAMHPVSRAVRAGGMAIFSSDRTSQPEVGLGVAFISSFFHSEDESSESQFPQDRIKTVARPRRVQPPSVIHCGSRANGGGPMVSSEFRWHCRRLPQRAL